MLDQWSADLHRYAQGGSFPKWRDKDIAVDVGAYATLHDTDYSNKDIRSGLDRRADALIQGAREFIDETVADAEAEYPDTALPEPPSVTTVLLNRHWPKDGFAHARRALTDDHFEGRLRAANRA